MNQKQKLIVTLWKGQLDSPSSYHSVVCRLAYHQQQSFSKSIHTSKSLCWKQTFIFPLAKQSAELDLDFINLQEIQEIHYAKEQVLDGLSIGRSSVVIDLDKANKGVIPIKLHIRNATRQKIGVVFLEYEIMKSQVTHHIEKLLDYDFTLKLSRLKLSFIRPLAYAPSFYLKCILSNRMQKQDFAFEESQDQYYYHYPVTLYLKNQEDLEMQLQIRGIDSDKRDYLSANTSFDSQSVTSIHKNIRNKPLELQTDDLLSCTLSLNPTNPTKFHDKLPVNLKVRKSMRQVGFLQFQAEITLKTQQQKQEPQIYESESQNNKSQSIPTHKHYRMPKNGVIIVNSLIGKLQLSDNSILNDKNVSIELQLGKSGQLSSVLQRPGPELIWIDTFVFRRTWEQYIRCTVYLHSEGLAMPKYYSQMNLRGIIEGGKCVAQRVSLEDRQQNYCGHLIANITYKELESKMRSVQSKKNATELTAQQREQQAKNLRRQLIAQRMKNRRLKREEKIELESSISSFSGNELILPPIASHRSISLSTGSANSVHAGSNIYNGGGRIFISKARRFEGVDKKESGNSFLYRPESEFESKKRGPLIGYGQKHDFTKPYREYPGVGHYEIPSVWSKYS